MTAKNFKKSKPTLVALHTLTAVVALILLPTAYAAIDTAAKAAQDPCTAATQARALAGQMAITIKEAAVSAAEAVKKAAQMRIMATSSDAAMSTALRIRAAAAARYAAEITSEIAATADKITRGIAAVEQVAATSEAISVLSLLKLGDVTPANPSSYTGSGANKLTFTLQNNHGACYTDASNRQAATEGTTKGPKDTDQISIGIVKLTTVGSQGGDPLSVCATSGGTTITAGTACETTGTKIGIKGGSPLTHETTAVKRTESDGDLKYDTAQLAGSIFPSKAEADRTLQEIAAGLDAARQLQQKTIMHKWLSIEGFIPDDAALAKILKGEAAKPDGSDTKPLVDSINQQLYGKDNSKLKDKLENGLKNFKPGKAAIGDENKKLDSINDPDELYKAETYYTLKRFVDEEEEKKKKSSTSPSCPTKTEKASEPTKSADECKKHTTEKPCKDEKGCDFDEKKPEGERCFPKVETEKKDEKSFSSNLRVSVPQVFSALVLKHFKNLR
uniref:Variant surface glycoprotein 479 n=1 Tax=Trypanosoma brucei TaxID=5691 RepID=M4SX52_9TRYP|nr:variant surface glycoprotein 479 [Trypanosoma brucei]